MWDVHEGCSCVSVLQTVPVYILFENIVDCFELFLYRELPEFFSRLFILIHEVYRQVLQRFMHTYISFLLSSVWSHI